MSLTRAFRKLQAAHPEWNYKQLAYELNTADNVLRSINQRIKLPVPVRAKNPDGMSKRKLGIRAPSDAHKKPRPKPLKITKPARPLSTVSLIGSGRKQYGSYLKLL